MMGFLVAMLYVLEALVCLLLMGAILVQRTKSQGMGLALGSGMGEAMFGSQAGNVMTRATVILATIFLANTTLLAIIGTHRVERSAADSAVTAPAEPAVPVNAPGPAPYSAPAPAGADGFAPLASAPAAGGVPAETVPVTIPDSPAAVPAEAVPAPAADPAPTPAN